MRLSEAQQAFFAARRPRKDSPHTTDAYRRDLAGITALLVSELGRPAEDLEVAELTGPARSRTGTRRARCCGRGRRGTSS
nr:hypothetical protein [Amycolatopsis sp. SID8362]